MSATSPTSRNFFACDGDFEGESQYDDMLAMATDQELMGGFCAFTSQRASVVDYELSSVNTVSDRLSNMALSVRKNPPLPTTPLELGYEWVLADPTKPGDKYKWVQRPIPLPHAEDFFAAFAFTPPGSRNSSPQVSPMRPSVSSHSPSAFALPKNAAAAEAFRLKRQSMMRTIMRVANQAPVVARASTAESPYAHIIACNSSHSRERAAFLGDESDSESDSQSDTLCASHSASLPETPDDDDDDDDDDETQQRKVRAPASENDKRTAKRNRDERTAAAREAKKRAQLPGPYVGEDGREHSIPLFAKSISSNSRNDLGKRADRVKALKGLVADERAQAWELDEENTLRKELAGIIYKAYNAKMETMRQRQRMDMMLKARKMFASNVHVADSDSDSSSSSSSSPSPPPPPLSQALADEKKYFYGNNYYRREGCGGCGGGHIISQKQDMHGYSDCGCFGAMPCIAERLAPATCAEPRAYRPSAEQLQQCVCLLHIDMILPAVRAPPMRKRASNDAVSSSSSLSSSKRSRGVVAV